MSPVRLDRVKSIVALCVLIDVPARNEHSRGQPLRREQRANRSEFSGLPVAHRGIF